MSLTQDKTERPAMDMEQSKVAPSRPKWNILVLCCWVVIPMLAFTAVILWLIFGYRISPDICPYPELCMTPEELNLTDSRSHYIVDFPAARLVFIASWSSTLSLSLLGALMGICTYSVASAWLRKVEREEHSSYFPTPYETALLLRILNAEFMTLTSLSIAKLEDVFWTRAKSSKATPTNSGLLTGSVAIFVVGLCLSLFIQGADTYLHITTEAVEWVEINGVPSSERYYSHALGDWCLNRKTIVSYDNNDFWGCSINFTPNYAFEDLNKTSDMMDFVNWTSARSLGMDRFSDGRVLDLVDENGGHTALVGPRIDNTITDWEASSFGVSTHCRAVPPDLCDVSETFSIDLGNGTTQEGWSATFNCSTERAGLNASGVLVMGNTKVSYLDFHRYIESTSAYFSWNDYTKIIQAARKYNNMTMTNKGDTVFSNPWNWFAIITTNFENSDDKRLWSDRLSQKFLMIHCNSTVLDVEKYTVVNNRVKSISHHPSNSSTTGLVSMVTSPVLGYGTYWWDKLLEEGIFEAKDVDHSISMFEQGASRLLTYPFAGQVVTRPAFQVQERHPKLVSKVPRAAVWSIIMANLLFALFAIALTVHALLEATGSVHQVCTRLNTMGLSAQLFEESSISRSVKSDKDLFEEHDENSGRTLKRVAVEISERGGAMYSLLE